MCRKSAHSSVRSRYRLHHPARGNPGHPTSARCVRPSRCAAQRHLLTAVGAPARRAGLRPFAKRRARARDASTTTEAIVPTLRPPVLQPGRTSDSFGSVKELVWRAKPMPTIWCTASPSLVARPRWSRPPTGPSRRRRALSRRGYTRPRRLAHHSLILACAFATSSFLSVLDVADPGHTPLVPTTVPTWRVAKGARLDFRCDQNDQRSMAWVSERR